MTTWDSGSYSIEINYYNVGEKEYLVCSIVAVDRLALELRTQ